MRRAGSGPWHRPCGPGSRAQAAGVSGGAGSPDADPRCARRPSPAAGEEQEVDAGALGLTIQEEAHFLVWWAWRPKLTSAGSPPRSPRAPSGGLAAGALSLGHSSTAGPSEKPGCAGPRCRAGLCHTQGSWPSAQQHKHERWTPSSFWSRLCVSLAQGWQPQGLQARPAVCSAPQASPGRVRGSVEAGAGPRQQPPLRPYPSPGTGLWVREPASCRVGALPCRPPAA